MPSFREESRHCPKPVRFVLSLLIITSCCVTAFVPGLAYAAFNEAATAYPAAQDLGSFEAPIYGSDLPDGSYQVTARTSSRMCIMYTDPTNAEARGSKEQAIVIASGGTLTAVFYISMAYTHMYWGTAEEAAAATNEDGTDASAYVGGDPDEGYTPHLFSIPISALNDPMTISFYSGGDRGWENGKWYTRDVVFSMSDAEYQSIIASAAEPEQIDPATDETEGDSVYEEESTYGEEELEESSDEDEESEVQPELTEETVTMADDEPEGSGSGTGSGDGGGSGDSGDGNGASDTQSSGAAGVRGVRMHGVSSKLAVDLEGAQGAAPEEVEKPLLTKQQILTLALLAIFAGGLVLRVVLFNRAYDRAERFSRGSPLVSPAGAPQGPSKPLPRWPF